MSTSASSMAARAAASAAQRHAARTVVAAIARALRAFADLRRRQREAARTRREIAHLDDITLRDLGLRRGEAGSVAAEAHGFAPPSRRLSTASRFESRAR